MVGWVLILFVHPALDAIASNALKNLSPGVLFQRLQKHFPNFNFAAFALKADEARGKVPVSSQARGGTCRDE
jgi:hypothetical protein